MPHPTISIIVPVYNAAAYIEQCIGSILQQTMQDTEVIAVNDGSTDNSGALLDRLAANDQRLKVFHNSNKGVSATRNFALQQATGTYIGFCDADDWMEPAMLEELYNAMTTNNCNWAICNIYMIKEGQPVKTRLQLKDQVIDITDNRGDFVHGLMRFNYDYANWNKLFDASIIRQHQIRFEEDMTIWEDLLFNLQYLHYAKRVAIIAKPLYHYHILSTSLYSGQTKDRLPQFNKLYSHYKQLSSMFTTEAETEAFKKEMARLTYNHLLYEAEVRVKGKNKYFFSVWNGFIKELKRFEPAVFYYPAPDRTGLQGIKKTLLVSRDYTLFALIIASKPYLKKPVKFILKLLNR